MTLDVRFPARLAREAPARPASRCLARWRGRDATLDASAVSGRLTGVLVRSGTATAVDGAGVTYTASPHAPRHEMRDLSGDGVRDTCGLRLTTDDLTWSGVAWRPQAVTLAVAFVEEGTRAAGGGLLGYGRDDGTGARLWIDAAGGAYRVTHHNGTSSVTATLGAGTPTAGQRALLAAQLRADGAVRLLLALDGSTAETATGWSSPLALATAWGTDARWRANRVGSSGTQGNVWLRDWWCCPGEVPLLDLERWS